MTTQNSASASDIQYFTSHFAGADGRLSAYDLHYQSKGTSPLLVVFVHGYKGFKDWGPWNLVAQTFARSGIDFLKFNLSHNGSTLSEPVDIIDLEAFAKNTYSKELADVHTILNMATEGINIGSHRLHWQHIALIGHSRGGAIATLAASTFSRLMALCTWAAVADFGERFTFDVAKWKQDGVAYVLNSRTGQQLPHYYDFFEDYFANKEKLDVLKAASLVDCPVLVVHGEEDEAVDPIDGIRLDVAFAESSLMMLPDAGHTFGGSHPWTDAALPELLEVVVEETIDFLLKNR